MDSLHKKNIRHDNFHICHQLNLQQKEYIKFQNITIDHLRGQLESNQKVLQGLLDTLKQCLHSQSTSHDGRHFSLQDTHYKFDQKISITTIFLSICTRINVIDKETINENHEKSNTQRSNQKSTKDEIRTDVIKYHHLAIKIRHLPVNIMSRNYDKIINQQQD